MDDPFPLLTPTEVRVLGALIEKQVTTPDYYPLTLNALTNACNQLTNREPVVSYDEQTVLRTLDTLRDKRLATHFSGAESRVAKYKQGLTEALHLSAPETALMCVLMLRGPQTVGELRSRSERLFAFESLAQAEDVLAGLASRSQPLVTRLPRQPGTKEPRHAHLLSGPVENHAAAAEAAPASSALAASTPAASEERLAKLETECSELRRALGELERQFADFRKQFE